MSSTTRIFDQVSKWAGEPIIKSESLSGGSIAQSYKLTTAAGKFYFLKTGSFDGGMFVKEANGLKELRKAQAIRIPAVHLVERDFLLLEYIPQGSSSRDFFEKFGREFARLHRFQSKQFGFFEDNFIGSTPQPNIPDSREAHNWIEFYFRKRLLFQYRLAEQNGYVNSALREAFLKLEKRIEQILAGSVESPSLLHGDLWSGNFLVTTDGHACLIDPAVYYGHREADLAMTRLFGGFGDRFYAAYQESFPLLPGHEQREGIYKLYHVLNHLNLFGTGYFDQAMRLLRQYTR